MKILLLGEYSNVHNNLAEGLRALGHDVTLSTIQLDYQLPERFELEWNLDETIKSTGALSVSITPYGSGTKTIYVLVDGAVHSTHTVTTTGRRFTVSLDLAIGAHEVVAYGEMQAGSTVVTSNTLTCAVAQWTKLLNMTISLSRTVSSIRITTRQRSSFW